MNLWTHSAGAGLARPIWRVLIAAVVAVLLAPTMGSGQEMVGPVAGDTSQRAEGDLATTEPAEAAGDDQADGDDQAVGVDDKLTELPSKTPIPPLRDESTRQAFTQMLAALLVVLVMVVVAIMVGKKFLPRLVNQGRRQLRLMETLHLAPKSTVHLVRVGQRVFLLGASKEGMTSLGDVTDATTAPPEVDKEADDE